MKKVLVIFLFVFALPAFAMGINGASAPCDNATLSKYTGTADIEINWEPNTINLNWYDGDTKLTVANSAQSCVYDSTITVPPQPTKPGYTFNGWKVIHVPGGFTELEYLQSSGTQYINTGIRGDQDTKAEIKFVVTATNCDTWNAIFGARQQAQVRAFTLWAPLDINPGNMGVHYGYTRQASTVLFSSHTTYTVELSKNGLIINDIFTTIPQQSDFTTPDDILLFNTSGGSSSSGGGIAGTSCGANRALIGKVYYFRLYENNNLVRNMIPAKRNSDNVVGMYDTVTDTFFTNAGSGTFVAGPAVQ